jgi:hypothetical protein
LDQQVAENFVLIEENQQLKEENGNLLAALRERLEQLRDEAFPIEPESPFQDCCVCMSDKANCALSKCGHVCLCNRCVSAWELGGKVCPVCRQKVESVVKLYL